MKKVWIYQADRFFTSAEFEQAKAYLEEFVMSWAAHGTALSAKVEILRNLFIVFTVDEAITKTTGCSIDRSVHVLKELEERLDIGLFNRTFVAYIDREDRTQLVSREVFQGLVDSSEVTSETRVFNNLVQTEEDFKSKWIVPFQTSWHAKVFG